jgi:hypothetical protein
VVDRCLFVFDSPRFPPVARILRIIRCPLDVLTYLKYPDSS